MRLTIITPTADQPIGFALCERYMRRQSYPGETAQWIVVDDGDTPARVTLGQTYVRRNREPRCLGYESLCRNLLAALPLATGELIVFVEHDDWYGPDHLRALVSAAIRNPKALLIGDDTQRYYNVAQRCWRIFANVGASLCQTAIRAEVVPLLMDVIKRCLDARSYGIDTTLWRALPRERWCLTEQTTMLGIKGLPGRPGLGIGHRPSGREWTQDRDGNQLRQWIGTEDAEIYLNTLQAVTS